MEENPERRNCAYQWSTHCFKVYFPYNKEKITKFVLAEADTIFSMSPFCYRGQSYFKMVGFQVFSNCEGNNYGIVFNFGASRFERVEDGLIEELREMNNKSNNETNKNILNSIIFDHRSVNKLSI